MGMFDTIFVKMPLPMPSDCKGYDGLSIEFQTKDFDNVLDNFEIREDKTLWKQKCEYETVPGNPNSKSIFGRIGQVKIVKSEWIQEKITDTIEIHNYVPDEHYDYWISYQLILVDGVVKEATLLDFNARNNSARKERDRVFNESLKKYHLLTKTIRYKVLYNPYNFVIQKIFLAFRKAVNKLGDLATYLYRKSCKLERKLTV